MKINSTIFFTIASLMYSVLLMIAYFSKDKIKTPENKVYSKLIIINFVGIVLEIFCTIFAGYAEEHMLFYTILNKLFLIELIAWGATFGTYVFLISSKKDSKEGLKRYMKKVLKLYIILILLISILVIMLPLQFKFRDGYVMYSYGDAANAVYFGIFISIFLTIICLIKNFKNIKSKKYLPIYVYLFVGTIVSFIQKMIPELLLATTMDTFITVIMYFTIENPDKKLLEEIHMSKKIADAANEDKSMLIYNMMNEVKSIASDINKSSEVILNSNNLEENRFFAREIISSNNKLYSMANNIYNIDVIDDINVKTVKNKYNIKLLLKKIVTLYSDECSKKGLTFRSDIASDLPEYLYGDNLGLKNVLTSILDNSIKYTKEGYIELNVNTIIKNNIARLIITIEDSGVGISPDEMDSIFYKRKEEIDGSNMKSNLFTARKLITLMGGTIIPSSNYGNGTTMKIVLDQKIVEEANEKYNKYESFYDEKKILLVDDNISTEKIISKLIRDTNIKLDYVSLGKEALDKIRGKEKYDLILLDEVMDPLDGVTVMKKFKDIRNFKTNVILLTRNNEYEYNEEYLKYGFSGYLLKPISKDKLFEIIDKYLK